jgi:hypothetical protein
VRLITATFSEFSTHPVDREKLIMFNIGGISTRSSSFSSLVGIGCSMLLEGLEAITIFINVPRDIILKILSISLDPRS